MMLHRFIFIFFMSTLPALAAEAPANTSEPVVTIEEFLQRLSTVPGVVGRKDPFAKVAPPFARPAPIQEEVFLPQSDLERYDLKKYTVTAVLLGDEYNRALIRLPSEAAKGGASAPVVIVREKDRIGNRGGVITNINKSGVIVLQTVKSSRGVVDRTVVTLPVGTIEADSSSLGRN